jgi:Group II intron, maturase-specific domain
MKGLISWAVICMLACRVGCGRSGGSCATTCTAGPRSGRWRGPGKRIKFFTGRNRVGQELQDLIKALNLFLRGWGNYFRTGSASTKFIQLDRYVVWRLKRLLIKKRGRNLRAGQVDKWTSDWFHDQGLHQLMGTIRYPKGNHAQKTVGKPCAGKPHARIERGMGKQGRYAAPAPLTTSDRAASFPV